MVERSVLSVEYQPNVQLCVTLYVHLGCAVFLCLVVCLTLLAFLFLPSHLSLKQYMHYITLFFGLHVHSHITGSDSDNVIQFTVVLGPGENRSCIVLDLASLNITSASLFTLASEEGDMSVMVTIPEATIELGKIHVHVHVDLVYTVCGVHVAMYMYMLMRNEEGRKNEASIGMTIRKMSYLG